jgi:hypothetical protein
MVSFYLRIHPIIIYISVKPEGQERLTLNVLQDKCPDKYRYEDIVDDHKTASYVFIRGIWLSVDFHLADYRLASF